MVERYAHFAVEHLSPHVQSFMETGAIWQQLSEGNEKGLSVRKITL
jgi:hypothetical protein